MKPFNFLKYLERKREVQAKNAEIEQKNSFLANCTLQLSTDLNFPKK
jgi:hypothetical protein